MQTTMQKQQQQPRKNNCQSIEIGPNRNQGCIKRCNVRPDLILRGFFSGGFIYIYLFLFHLHSSETKIECFWKLLWKRSNRECANAENLAPPTSFNVN